MLQLENDLFVCKLLIKFYIYQVGKFQRICGKIELNGSVEGRANAERIIYYEHVHQYTVYKAIKNVKEIRNDDNKYGD